MIDIKVIGSGSSGNCYLANINGTKILIEAGLPFKKIQKALNYRISEIEGCFVTHEHLDHAKAVNDLMKNGVDVLMTRGTSDALEVYGHRLQLIEKKENNIYKSYTKNNVKLQAFEAVHDVNEPVSFYIQDIHTKESLLFVTDTAYMKYKIPNVDVLMVECNYVKSILDNKVEEGKIHISLRNRIVRNHMSLETLLEALKGFVFNKLKKVYILHLSDGNSDEKLILDEIQRVLGVVVEVC